MNPLKGKRLEGGLPDKAAIMAIADYKTKKGVYGSVYLESAKGQWYLKIMEYHPFTEAGIVLVGPYASVSEALDAMRAWMDWRENNDDNHVEDVDYGSD